MMIRNHSSCFYLFMDYVPMLTRYFYTKADQVPWTSGAKVLQGHWHALTLAVDLPNSKMTIWVDGEVALEICDPSSPLLRCDGPLSLDPHEGMCLFGRKPFLKKEWHGTIETIEGEEMNWVGILQPNGQRWDNELSSCFLKIHQKSITFKSVACDNNPTWASTYLLHVVFSNGNLLNSTVPESVRSGVGCWEHRSKVCSFKPWHQISSTPGLFRCPWVFGFAVLKAGWGGNGWLVLDEKNHRRFFQWNHHGRLWGEQLQYIFFSWIFFWGYSKPEKLEIHLNLQNWTYH